MERVAALQAALNKRMLHGTPWRVELMEADYGFSILATVYFRGSPQVGMCVGFDVVTGERRSAWTLDLIGAVYKYCIEQNMEMTYGR